MLPVHVVDVVQDPWFQRPPKPSGDGLEYENIGFHVWQGEGFAVRNKDADWLEIYRSKLDVYQEHLDAPERNMLTTGRPPLFPTVIAAVYCLFGRDEFSFGLIRIFSGVCLAIAGAMAASLTAGILSRSSASSGAGRWSVVSVAGVCVTIVLAASNRTLQGYAHDFLTEPLALLLMQAFVLLVICSNDEHRDKVTEGGSQSPLGFGGKWLNYSLVGSGLVFGGLILTRSIFVLWIPGIWLLWLAASSELPSVAARKATFWLAITLVTCLPWWVRNVSVLGEFMPLGTQGPITLCGAYSDEGRASGGDWAFAPEQRLRESLREDLSFSQLKSDEQREVMVAKSAKKQVSDWIKSHGADLPGMFLSRIVTHWNPYTGRSLLWKILILIGVCVLMAPTRWNYVVVGRKVRVWMMGLPILSTLVVACLYTTGGRFLVPLYGILFTLAGIGFSCALAWLLAGFRSSDSGVRA